MRIVEIFLEILLFGYNATGTSDTVHTDNHDNIRHPGDDIINDNARRVHRRLLH